MRFVWHLNVFLLLLLGFGCRDANSGVEAAIAQEVSRGPGAVVDMRSVAGSAWSRFHIFPPYTIPEQVHHSLGFRWGSAASSGIQHSDAINLLVFTDGERVVRYVALPRGQGDFYRAFREGGYARDSARFVVQQEGHLTSGAPHLVLHPIP